MLIGTYIKFKMIQYLTSIKRSSNTLISVDDLILFEQKVNLISAPLILMQMLRIMFPLKEILGNLLFCSFWAVLQMLVLFHRAIGGLGIAGVRQVAHKK